MDGYCDIVIMGTGFNTSHAITFFNYANLVKNNLLKREPFKTRSTEIRFHIINAKQNIGVKPVGGFDMSLNVGSSLVIQKIKKELGNTPVNILHLVSWTNGFGGAVGNISAIGLNELKDPFANDPNYCKYDLITRGADAISPHEIGHSFGLEHDDTSLNIMAGVYTTNGGCGLIGALFTPEHQLIISDFIDRAKS